jgi:hypothetical protein
MLQHTAAALWSVHSFWNGIHHILQAPASQTNSSLINAKRIADNPLEHLATVTARWIVMDDSIHVDGWCVQSYS